jgi:hypothetical protein
LELQAEIIVWESIGKGCKVTMVNIFHKFVITYRKY